jgi:anti-sigma-K factor RskA
VSQRDRIAAYVLGELEPAEAERLRAREAADPGFAAEVAAMRALVATVEDLGTQEWEPLQPPPLALTPSVEAREERPADERRRRRRLVLRPAFAALAAVALLAVGAVAGALIAGGGAGGGGQVVALSPVGDGPPTASGDARLSGDTMRLRVTGLPQLRGGAFYEVWMLRSPQDLVSVGGFRVSPDGSATVDMPVTASPRQYPVIDISREPNDGNPAHSTLSVLRSKPS